MRLDVFKTTTTRYTSLRVLDYPRMAQFPERVCVMECPVTDLRVGDVLVVSGHFEVTNKLTYSVEVGRRLTLESGSGGIQGVLVSPDAGENVTPQQAYDRCSTMIEVWHGQHHMLIPFSGVHVVATESPLKYISLGAYAGGSSMTGPNDWLMVEQTTNHLDVLRFRQVDDLQRLVDLLVAKGVLTESEFAMQ